MHIMRKHLRGKIRKGSGIKQISPFLNYSFGDFSIVFEKFSYTDSVTDLVTGVVHHIWELPKDMENLQLIIKFSLNGRVTLIIKRKAQPVSKFFVPIDAGTKLNSLIPALIILSRSVILEREFICSDRW